MASTGYGAIESRVVQFKGHGGDAISGYLSRPGDGQQHPGVIVISEVFGLVNHIRELTFKFAGNGYVALAPDLGKARACPRTSPPSCASRAASQTTGPLVTWRAQRRI
ncbi:MAG: dienelactone hydrolase family protein [Chloroflexi bacterium]|nr:dienelactone hydrolase family protein [Chloroflexota bacterium]